MAAFLLLDDLTAIVAATPPMVMEEMPYVVALVALIAAQTATILSVAAAPIPTLEKV
jgi:hypothetical protein